MSGIEREDSERPKLERAGALHWFHWLAISLSLGLTFGAWYFSKSQLDAKVGFQFEREADRVTALVLERMEKYEDALWGGVGMATASGGDVPHQRWLAFSESLRIDEKYPGVNGIGVILNVPKSQLADFDTVVKPRFEPPVAVPLVPLTVHAFRVVSLPVERPGQPPRLAPGRESHDPNAVRGEVVHRVRPQEIALP